jgi:hypothetical protein
MPITTRPLRATACAVLALGCLTLTGCAGGGGTSGGGGSSSGGSSSGTTGSAALSWVAPTTNTDGSALTDLAGYHVYYGTAADLLDRNLAVSDASATVGSLTAGTWYFAVAAVNSGGVEGGLSNVASKTIN